MSALDYRVIAVDETRNWDDAITAITGKIAGVYVVNFGEVVHICSLQGSYWAEFLRNITEHYVREPDGYSNGAPIWDSEWAAENPEAYDRSVKLEALLGDKWLTYDNSGEPGCYFDERGLRGVRSSGIDMADAGWQDEENTDWTDEQKETYRKERDGCAYDAARYYECNGEEWESLAPWKKEDAV